MTTTTTHPLVGRTFTDIVADAQLEFTVKKVDLRAGHATAEADDFDYGRQTRILTIEQATAAADRHDNLQRYFREQRAEKAAATAGVEQGDVVHVHLGGDLWARGTVGERAPNGKLQVDVDAVVGTPDDEHRNRYDHDGRITESRTSRLLDGDRYAYLLLDDLTGVAEADACTVDVTVDPATLDDADLSPVAPTDPALRVRYATARLLRDISDVASTAAMSRDQDAMDEALAEVVSLLGAGPDPSAL